MNGAAWPSGMDVSSWKKICSSFGSESVNLCESVACVARKLCSCYVDPSCVSAFVACRLNALDKNPGVRPIGIGEVCRRLIGKTVLSVIKHDIVEAAGLLQLCAGQSSACEAISYTIKRLYDSSSNSDGLLFVDASNAFNALNRELAVRNNLHLCPSLGRIVINTYRSHSSLFIDNETILSREGTTQGDPLAMAMFAIASIPLINELSSSADVKQLWYADDASAIGSFVELRKWWDNINTVRGAYGYFPNAEKTSLLVKDNAFDLAREIFDGSGA